MGIKKTSVDTDNNQDYDKANIIASISRLLLLQ